MPNWTLELALTALARNGYRPQDNVFTLNAHNPPGLKLWGALDYLRNYHSYIVRT